MEVRIMRFGADYYPEHWPEERWEEDARLMQEAGFNTVRLAEFAWAKMEPEEGRFEFDWLIKVLDILANHGIQAVIGTPTAAPPPWLCTNKPNILRVNEDRLPIPFGHRQQYCINQPDYEAATDRIVTAMAEALSGHEAVMGWQPDNEFGPMCYCEQCQKRFQEWLQEKFVNLHALNEAWGTIFWSQTYSDWQQIPLPWRIGGPQNPSLALDFRRFVSEAYAKYQQRQINIIRKFSNKPITHNFMGIWPEILNYQHLADQLDFVSWDNYPATAFGVHEPAGVCASHDQTRGLARKNFWVMEQLSGPCGWGDLGPSPQPGQIRKWTYHAIGRGADGIVYFRWRPCLSGLEQYWHGILNHDGSVNRRYAEVKRTGEELKKLSSLLEGTTVKAEAAFLNDYDSRFAFQQQRGNQAFSYYNLFMNLYRGFYNSNTPVDILSRDWPDLSSYKLIVAPALFVLTEERANLLRNYVQNGGTLVMTFRSAVKDKNSLIFNEPLPGLLQDVFGATVKEYHSPWPDETNTIWGQNNGVKGLSSQASVWLDLMELKGAKVIAQYDEGFIPHEVAITRNDFGQGHAYYIGTQPSQEFSDALMASIAKDAGIKAGIETPEGVDASIRSGETGDLLFLINHNREKQHINLPGKYTELITGTEVIDSVEIPRFGVAIINL